MITNKDREDAESIYHTSMQVYAGSLEDSTLCEMVSRIRTESAEQARKEAVDSETLSDIRRICEIIVGNNFGNHELDSLAFYVGHHPAILNSTAQERKTDSEKLAIAVKALEVIESKWIPSIVFESQYSRLQDACTIARNTLKEIQG